MINEWIDAEGFLWRLDLDDPCILSAMREVLEIRFQQHIWLTASAEHCAPLGAKPDITAYKILKKEYANMLSTGIFISGAGSNGNSLRTAL